MLHMYQQVETRAGKRQWVANLGGGKFMMLPVDMALHWDPEYRKWLQHYDRKRREFRKDAAKAWAKLIELGCDTDHDPKLAMTAE